MSLKLSVHTMLAPGTHAQREFRVLGCKQCKHLSCGEDKQLQRLLRAVGNCSPGRALQGPVPVCGGWPFHCRHTWHYIAIVPAMESMHVRCCRSVRHAVEAAMGRGVRSVEEFQQKLLSKN